MSTPLFLPEIWASLGGAPEALRRFSVTGGGDLPSAFAATDFAVAAIGTAGLATSELISVGGSTPPAVVVDRRLASLWYGFTLRPQDWSLPPAWDPIAGDYEAADGWIRLHTNAPHHRAAALAVLATPPEREAVAAAVRTWRADDLETAVVVAGGCAAAMRTLNEWRAHPQGASVAAEPLVACEIMQAGPGASRRQPDPSRPLSGTRVLDLTRVLAGPVATRFLAGLGAEVLRIDPPNWDEPGVVPEVTLGKRRARLNLRQPDGRAWLLGLLAEADVLVHGYRPGALARLGLGEDVRRRVRPGLVEASLDAYGWSGPWAGRRGFDSLVQMSAGIAAEGMRRAGKDRPVPLPVQALDHSAGYLLAAGVLRGLRLRHETGRGSSWRTSLARVAHELASSAGHANGNPPLAAQEADYSQKIEQTSWGPARRMLPPVTIEGAPLRWDRPSGPLGSDEAVWS